MSFKFKNSFYRKLKLSKDFREAIKFYNNIKTKMQKDLGKEGYYVKRRRKNK